MTASQGQPGCAEVEPPSPASEPSAAMALMLRNAIADAAARTRLSDYKTGDLGTARKPPKKVEITADFAWQIVAAIEAASPADASLKTPDEPK